MQRNHRGGMERSLVGVLPRRPRRLPLRGGWSLRCRNVPPSDGSWHTRTQDSDWCDSRDDAHRGATPVPGQRFSRGTGGSHRRSRNQNGGEAVPRILQHHSRVTPHRDQGRQYLWGCLIRAAATVVPPVKPERCGPGVCPIAGSGSCLASDSGASSQLRVCNVSEPCLRGEPLGRPSHLSFLQHVMQPRRTLRTCSAPSAHGYAAICFGKMVLVELSGDIRRLG